MKSISRPALAVVIIVSAMPVGMLTASAGPTTSRKSCSRILSVTSCAELEKENRQIYQDCCVYHRSPTLSVLPVPTVPTVPPVLPVPSQCPELKTAAPSVPAHQYSAATSAAATYIEPPRKTQIKRFYLSGTDDSALFTIMAEMKKNPNCKPNRTLFVADVDETVLLSPSDKAQRDRAVPIRHSDKVIAALREAGYTVLALTFREAILSESIEWLFRNLRNPQRNKELYLAPNYLKQNLAEAGVDFSKTSEKFSRAKRFLDEKGKYGEKGFFRLRGNGPIRLYDKKDLASLLYYEDGIIMSSGHAKGETLLYFLRLTNQINAFDCIYFVDDLPSNHDSMELAFKRNSTKKKVYLYHIPEPGPGYVQSPEPPQPAEPAVDGSEDGPEPAVEHPRPER